MSNRRKISTFNPPAVVNPDPVELAKQDRRDTFASPKPELTKRRFSRDELLCPVPQQTTAADLDFIDTLSRGSFAELVRVRRRDTGQIMVAKAFNAASWRSEYLCSSELRLLDKVNSPWLIGYYGHIQDLDEDFLLLEYVPLGNFYQIMMKQNRPLVREAKFYGAEMFLAADALHQEGFMHRNIQLSNFLVHSSGHLRLCDFGMSYEYDQPTLVKKGSKRKLSLITNPVYASAENSAPRTITKPPTAKPAKFDTRHPTDVRTFTSECTTSYLAPEVLRLLMPKTYFRLLRQKVGYSYLCDYWALGVCLYHMMYGFLPFLPDSKGTIFDKVLDFHKTLAFPMTTTSAVSLEGLDVMKELLKKEKRRLGRNDGFEEVKAHPFFADMQWNYLGHGKVSVPVKDSEMARYTMPNSAAAAYEPRKVTGQEKDSSEDSGGEEEASFRQALSAHEMDFKMPMIGDPTVPCMQKRTAIDSMGRTHSAQDLRISGVLETAEVSPARTSSFTKDLHSADQSGTPGISQSDSQTIKVKPGPSKAPHDHQKHAGKKIRASKGKEGKVHISSQNSVAEARTLTQDITIADTTFLSRLVSWFHILDTALLDSPEASQG